ncbi:MAG TPA: tRNA uridine-5-carboxymethylaminomethyl(34) synthesis GTPase MnmE [Thermohalobaculum sp.]|nr:tRNA uridine-5-carboxymethylaminomethyl(34) synthesis GTPase MnmE [Thermohalobaculum sp.]
MTPRETIFAPASGHGRAGISVIRISGPEADAALSRLTGRKLPPQRQAALRELRDSDGGVLDQALVLRFAAGASYTGEPVVELQCHGGRAVTGAVLAALSELPGCRLAEPGEFTRRAFEAGRMDLAEVEALGDLLAAETELQRRQAIRGLGGSLQRQAEAWRRDLLRAAALVEVTIDWADEEVPENVSPEVAGLLENVEAGIDRELALSMGAERLRTGFEVAVLGAPNSGKSTLINNLAGRDMAITSPLPGTTRDVLELRYDLDGLPVVFLDTAGLRDAEDEIEHEGISRAAARAEAAEMRLFLRASDAPPPEREAALWRPGDLRVWSKSDLGQGDGDISISAQTGDGLPELIRLIARELAGRAGGDGLVSHARQRRALESAREALVRARIMVETAEAELLAEELRGATVDLERLVGRIGVEDVLGEVFATFCLGK